MHAQILRLNLAGQPLEWLSWEEAACLYVRDLVTWTLGGIVQTVHGGINRQGERSKLDLAAIIACGGERLARPRTRPPLTNRALFARDRHLCLYCGNGFPIRELTRDHVHPVSKGGRDIWENVVLYLNCVKVLPVALFLKNRIVLPNVRVSYFPLQKGEASPG
ncbi:HNH endonuclease [Microbulbifer sp.]|uniref:HNH endonuclease n=1 Tax=Microbulbifer sp. TaxID=1908541 RepID=UPI00258ED3E7|nr:HNH endonuclease [Microbulbifer sp.]